MKKIPVYCCESGWAYKGKAVNIDAGAFLKYRGKEGRLAVKKIGGTRRWQE
jgi:hypothetical protein